MFGTDPDALKPLCQPICQLMFRLFAALLLLILVASCTKAGPSARFGSGPLVTASATQAIAALERKMAERLNRDRAKNGLRALGFDAGLADIARAHSRDMQLREFFEHESPYTGSLEDRLDRAGYLSLAARENLGQGGTVDEVEDALLESPRHYDNIMALDVTKVGVGIIDVGTAAEPELLVTQVFATPVKKQDPAAAKSAVLRSIAEARRAAGSPPLAKHGLLDELAQEHIDKVTTGNDAAVNKEISDAIREPLQESGFRGVAVATVAFLSPELFEPMSLAIAKTTKTYGAATAPGQDERGRPVIKVLILLGQ